MDLILSPHFDDAVLSCWTIITRAASPGVLTVFGGLPEPTVLTRYDRIAGANSSRTLVRARIAEEEAALTSLECPHRRLDYLDNQYRPGADSISKQGDGAPSPDDLLEDLGTLSKGDLVLAPMGLGGHADHILVRDFALSLAPEGVRVALYADVPYASHYGWPEWVSGDTATPWLNADADWQHYVGEVLARHDLRPEVRRLTEAERLRKLQAVEQYRTQFPSLNGGATDRLRHPVTLRFEVFWSSADSGA